jgi:hypothetical protein
LNRLRDAQSADIGTRLQLSWRGFIFSSIPKKAMNDRTNQIFFFNGVPDTFQGVRGFFAMQKTGKKKNGSD